MGDGLNQPFIECQNMAETVLHQQKSTPSQSQGYYWANFRHRQKLNSFDANKETPFFTSDQMTNDGGSDYHRASPRCDAKRVFMTFALLVIFVFILQVLFRHGMSGS